MSFNLSHWGIRAGWIRTVAVIAITLVTSAAEAANCVLIIGGHYNNPSGDATIATTNAIAEGQYTAKGYSVIHATTKAEILAALNQPCLRHMVFTGHGVYTDENTATAGVWIGPGSEDTDYLYASEVAAAIPQARRDSMVSVVFNACGQLQQEWADTFPNATIHGWTTKVTPWSIRCDQRFHGAGRINPKSGARGVETGGGLVDHPYDPLLADSITMIEVRPGRWSAIDAHDFSTYDWPIPEPLATEVGMKRFNFIVATSPADEVMIGGLEIAGGDCVSHSPTPVPMPSFMLRFSPTAFDAATSDFDSIPGLIAGGEIALIGNTTPVPPEKLLAAALAVTFGYTPVPPGCVGDADGSGAVDFGDVTSVLANFGASGPPFRLGDADGSGIVNFGDVTSVLANFGTICP